MERSDAYRRLARVRDEFDAARFALAHVLGLLGSGDITQPMQVTRSHVRLCSRHLEITYVLRLYAEYEGVLMDYWSTGMRRRSRPRMRILMERIASNQTMSLGHLADAHQVRDFRNEIVHRNLREARLTFGDCASRLGRYLSWLPVRW